MSHINEIYRETKKVTESGKGTGMEMSSSSFPAKLLAKTACTSQEFTQYLEHKFKMNKTNEQSDVLVKFYI